MLDYIFLTMLGCVFGVITGLTPGLHVNTVCIVGLGLYSRLGMDTIQFSVTMVAMSITHTFLDYIPAIFIGVPEESTALSVLPAHQLLLEGKSLDAVKLTAYGSLLGLVFSLLFIYPIIHVLPFVYNQVREYLVFIISLALLYLIILERGVKRKIYSFIIIILSGWLGVIALSLNNISSTQVLFPIFAGLFGLSGMLYSIKTKPGRIPQTPYSTVDLDGEVTRASLIGSVGGIFVGVLPAMSPSQIGIIMSGLYHTNIRSFLVSVSAINTSDAIYSLVALYAIQNPRSGVSVMISRILELDKSTMTLFIGVFAFSALFSTVIHLEIGKRATKFLEKVNYRYFSGIIFFMIFFLIYYFTGWFGVLLTIISICIGLLPILSGVSRTHLMGVLIIPTIIYYLGVV
jgi:putative membrane protein